MKENDEKYPKARYDFDTNPQVYGFKVGEIYRFRDFGRGVEVFYNDGCSLAMGYNMFNECFTKIMKTNEAPEKIYIQPSAIEQLPQKRQPMTREEKDIIKHAKEAARNTFNSLPFETRSKLANGYERLIEVELLLSKGDNLSIAFLKKRKRELEKWLLEWYNENKQ